MFQVIKINTLIGVIYVSSLMIQTCNLFQIHIVFANFINSIVFFYLSWCHKKLFKTILMSWQISNIFRRKTSYFHKINSSDILHNTSNNDKIRTYLATELLLYRKFGLTDSRATLLFMKNLYINCANMLQNIFSAQLVYIFVCVWNCTSAVCQPEFLLELQCCS